MKKPLLCSLLAASMAASSSAAVLRSGHADVGIAYEENKLFPHIHDEVNDVEYAPGSASFLVKYAARVTIPTDSAYNFLRPGGETNAWILPQVQNPDLLFLGFGAEEIETGVLANDQVTVRLSSIVAPAGGFFSLYTVDEFNAPIVRMNTGDGISAADSFVLPAGGHQHFNWSFTQPGDYKVAFTFTAKVGTVTKTATATYKFHVQTEAETTGAKLLVSRSGVGLDIGGVVLTIIENPDLASNVMLVTFSGEGVTAADNTAIIQMGENELGTVLVREGDEPANLSGAKLATLSTPVVNPAGQLVFSGTLVRDNVIVSTTSDTYLALKDGTTFNLIAREGEAAAGQAADWVWSGFGTRLLADNGVLVFNATIVNRSGPRLLTRTGYWRRLASGVIEPLAVTGTVLTTEIGLKAVMAIGDLNPGASRDQDRAFSNDGSLSLAIAFTDGTTSIVRFAAPAVSTP